MTIGDRAGKIDDRAREIDDRAVKIDDRAVKIDDRAGKIVSFVVNASVKFTLKRGYEYIKNLIFSIFRFLVF